MLVPYLSCYNQLIVFMCYRRERVISRFVTAKVYCSYENTDSQLMYKTLHSLLI